MNKDEIIKKGLPSFCTANFDVLKIIMKFSKIHNLPVLIECTSNQVNQYGGYTGLNPKNFKLKIDEIRKKIKLSRKQILLGGDHLGPLPWKNLAENKAMINAKILLKKYIKEKYDKIHIDTGILCSGQKKLKREEVIFRCEKLIRSINSKNLKDTILVVGTEVPFAGGGDHLKTNVTKLENIKKEFRMYKVLFNKYNSLKNKSFCLVIDPGMAFGNESITKSKLKNFIKKSDFSKKNNFVFEAHSSDYQSLKDLKKLNSLNFKFLKVGPELTFYYLKAALYMEDIEKKKFKKKSNLRKVISTRMNINKKYWKQYYKENKKKNEYLKFNSYLDRARYYWREKDVNTSKKILFKNIDNMNLDTFSTSFKLTKDDFKIKKILSLNNSNFIVYKFLKKTLEKYYLACNYKLNSN